ncbi:hypothetical protein GOBAR_AA38376 [Gossypium barbadense]|uniref:Uncharacterized protein n=1 Tax=Gossypium barbadense TaxID=3634 RepID=A0A2P5VU38_GOSBA|nr:hypothetical protein GOBAR_AA38376 [Gossypium barbadense]
MVIKTSLNRNFRDIGLFSAPCVRSLIFLWANPSLNWPLTPTLAALSPRHSPSPPQRLNRPPALSRPRQAPNRRSRQGGGRAFEKALRAWPLSAAVACPPYGRSPLTSGPIISGPAFEKARHSPPPLAPVSPAYESLNAPLVVRPCSPRNALSPSCGPLA